VKVKLISVCYSLIITLATLQMPTYFIPPLILDTVVPFKQFLTNNPQLVVPVTAFLLLISFDIGLPAAVGLYPQVSSIDADNMEEQFRGLGFEEFTTTKDYNSVKV
jgi:hypothetical protein